MAITEMFKNEEEVQVYLDDKYPDEICKKYNIVMIKDIEELKEKRKKLIQMKNKKDWPSFIIKPNYVGRFNGETFKARFPYIKGLTLEDYIKEKDMNLKETAKLIKSLEEKIYSEKDYVFSDVGNPKNIVIENDNLDFTLIDPDDVLFDNYDIGAVGPIVFPPYCDEKPFGADKCIENNKYNKQLEIRSMYGLFYYILNGNNLFYPCIIERESLEEYEDILKQYNIKENTKLYQKSMDTLNDNKPNEPLGDTLDELIDDGYEFKTYGQDFIGYKHILVKK